MTKLDIFLVLLNLLRNQLNFWRLSLQTLFLVKRCLLLLVSTWLKIAYNSLYIVHFHRCLQRVIPFSEQ